MAKNDGTESTPKPSKRPWPVPMKFLDPSHPIYANPTVITFGRNWTKSTPNSEEESEAPEETKPEPGWSEGSKESDSE